MTDRRATALVLLVLATGAWLSCRTAQAPAPPPEPVPEFQPLEVQPPAPPPPPPKTFVTVSGSRVNVRKGPGTDHPTVAKAKKGDRFELAGESGDWVEVRLADGSAGFVSAKYVVREAPCPPDSAGPEIVARPALTFSQVDQHGAIQLRISVDASGSVSAVKVVSNGTGDPRLESQAVAEATQLKFAPLIRRCKPQPFVYVFTRSF